MRRARSYIKRNDQFHILSVFLPISNEHKDFSHAVAYLITSNVGKKPKIMKNHYEPGLNSPEYQISFPLFKVSEP